MSEGESTSLLLASTSPYRRALLARLGLPFSVRDPQIVEQRQPRESAAEMVERLSRAKAAAFPVTAGIVIGSDQCAALGDRILGKPGGTEAAVAQLQAASGRTVSFYTGLCVTSPAATHYHLDLTQVRFRDLSEAEIRTYVAREAALDCAGSFKVEGLGICLFETVSGTDPTALQGLPLIGLSRLLRAQGLSLP